MAVTVAKIIAEWPEPSAWNKSYQALLVYVDQEGHADVPAKYQSPTGFALGKWVSQQRTRRRNSQMPESQERRLDRLPGWEWDKQQAAWDRSFEALEQFVTRERHARVPRSHKETVNKRVVQLGQWVNNQRKANKARALKPLRASKLDGVPGWEWEVLPGTDPPAAGRFRKVYGVDFHDELRLFVEKYGHALVPNGYSRPGSRQGNLGLWVAEQREKYWAGNLSLTEKASLDVFAGWAWSETEADFQTRLHAMRQFLNREGHINVPDDHREDYIGQKIDLASWLTPQLQQIKEAAEGDGDLHSGHYQLLGLIGAFIESEPDDPPNEGDPLEKGDPDELGPYRLRWRIGEGGQATVYYGESDNGVAAIKLSKPNRQSDKRFHREAGILEKVKSPRVAQLLEHKLTTKPPWIALEYIDGENLHEEHTNTKLSYDNSEIEERALGIAHCLADVHTLQVIHNDVKPSNIVMSDNGPVLIDFGIAQHPTVFGPEPKPDPVGTLNYKAPEPTKTVASDIYGWANILLFLKRGYPLGATEPIPSEAAIKATPGEILQMLHHKTLDPTNDPLFAVTGEPTGFRKHDTGIITGYLTDLPDEGVPGWDDDQEMGDARVLGDLPGDPDDMWGMSVNLYQKDFDSIQSDPEFETVDVMSWLEHGHEITIYARVLFVGAEARLQMEGIKGQDSTGPSFAFGLGAKLSDLVVRSLQPDPGLRPTATEIIEVLDTQRAGRDTPTRV